MIILIEKLFIVDNYFDQQSNILIVDNFTTENLVIL
jgi:hypothetical protein